MSYLLFQPRFVEAILSGLVSRGIFIHGTVYLTCLR